MGALANVDKVDQVKAFMLFAYFGGDTLKTAQACSVDERLIVALAHDFNWLGQIKGQNRLDTDEGRKLEQEANRARNYVMAQRIGLLIEHVVLKAASDPEAWAGINCMHVDAETGEKSFDSKPLVEIAKAVQIVQDMTYRATGDKMAATAATTEASDGKVTNLMINVYQGLDKLADTAKKMAKQVHPVQEAVMAAVVEPAKH